MNHNRNLKVSLFANGMAFNHVILMGMDAYLAKVGKNLKTRLLTCLAQPHSSFENSDSKPCVFKFGYIIPHT
jgi:hypothetical protein